VDSRQLILVTQRRHCAEAIQARGHGAPRHEKQKPCRERCVCVFVTGVHACVPIRTLKNAILTFPCVYMRACV